VILGPDRSKLSKRHGAVSVKNYREEGFLPQAMFNYLCLLGWSPPEEGREIYSKQELIKLFDLKDVNASPAVFDAQKLRWMNGVYIREVLSLEELAKELTPFLERAGYSFDKDYLLKVLQRARDAFETLSEAVDRLKPFFVDEVEYSEQAKGVLENQTAMQALEYVLLNLEGEELSGQKIKEIAKMAQKELGIKPKDFWHTLRAVLTGELEGVGVDVLCDVLPKDRFIKRVERALRSFQ
jgi:nondiscriminating glutamyl-tRNA synthetase